MATILRIELTKQVLETSLLPAPMAIKTLEENSGQDSNLHPLGTLPSSIRCSSKLVDVLGYAPSYVVLQTTAFTRLA